MVEVEPGRYRVAWLAREPTRLIVSVLTQGPRDTQSRTLTAERTKESEKVFERLEVGSEVVIRPCDCCGEKMTIVPGATPVDGCDPLTLEGEETT